MNGWLLDTNVIAELAKPQGSVRVHAWAAAQNEALLFLNILTLGEYDKGLNNLPPNSSMRAGVAAGIAAIGARFTGRILPVTDPIVRRWGTISGPVKRQTGQTPPVIDTLLAATAIEHALCLVTRNMRDIRHSGVTFLNPWEDDGSSGLATGSSGR